MFVTPKQNDGFLCVNSCQFIQMNPLFCKVLLLGKVIILPVLSLILLYQGKIHTIPLHAQIIIAWPSSSVIIYARQNIQPSAPFISLWTFTVKWQTKPFWCNANVNPIVIKVKEILLSNVPLIYYNIVLIFLLFAVLQWRGSCRLSSW